MKKILAFISVMILLLPIKSRAQENPIENGKVRIRAISLIEGGHQWNFNTTKNNRSSFDTTTIQFTGIYYSLLFFRDSFFALGIGTGLEYEKKFYVPFTVEGKFDFFSKRKFHPSVKVSWGGKFLTNESIVPEPQFNLGIGVNGKLNKKNSFTLQIGYAFQSYHYLSDCFDTHRSNYLFVRIGIIFLHKKKSPDKEPFFRLDN